MVTITVDGKTIETEDGALLIEVLLANGINIPHFCYHPALGKDGNCRMCMVEIEGSKRPQIACDTPAKEGMVIRTKGESIERVKRSILELELINHPIDCPICDQAGECSLQNYYMDVGLYDSRLDTPKVHGKKHEDLGANVVLDQERCVLCTRCVRFTSNITKTHELGVLQRNDHSVISTFPGTKLSNPYAMNVIDLCPVGALTSKDFRFHKRVWFLEPAEAICDGCARGCSLYVDHHRDKYKDDIIYRYRPRFNDDVNGYFICDYGRLNYKKENENRLLNAYIRGMESEFEYAKLKLERIIKRYGAKTLIVLSSNLSLEEYYRFKKLSTKLNLELNAYDNNIDEKFGDDFLKKNDKTANRKAVELLEIPHTLSELEASLKDKEFVMLVGRSDFNIINNLNYKGSIGVLCSHDFQQKDKLDIVFPIVSHTGRAGSFINCDGFVQFSQCEIKKDILSAKILDLLASILNDGIVTCEDVWEKGLGDEPFLKSIHFDLLQTKSQKIEML
ncbi:2Fe-2S iron-sulfur cluster-binding protein [Sulfurospirillum sp. 1612]|uniref:2Fe-2S iron-sulfur cluster-binding protein n=1 Tax=Sulfurospirillum sp. 1612 TaxID=3094835 RepID=UPI002F93EEB7